MPQTNKQLQSRYWNTLHGFQPSNDNLIIGFIPESFDTPENLAKIRSDTGSTTAKIDDFIGNTYIQVSIAEKHLIPDIVWTINGMGVNIRLQTRGQPIYSAANRLRLTIENSEKLILDNYNKYLQMSNGNESQALSMLDSATGGWQAHEPILWKTPEGKALASKFHTRETDDDWKFWLWPSFQNEPAVPELDFPIITSTTPTTTTETTTESTIAAEVTEEPGSDSEECMICLSEPPTTMVLPCMHTVVCSNCSRGLENTNDKSTCVRCRRPITQVLYDNE